MMATEDSQCLQKKKKITFAVLCFHEIFRLLLIKIIFVVSQDLTSGLSDFKCRNFEGCNFVANIYFWS